MAIKIITDSTADIPVDIAKELDIEIIPLTVSFNSKSYKDGLELTNEEFFKKLEISNRLPTTSQINPGEFVEVFEKYLDEYDNIICITLSSQMSGTYKAANVAKNFLNTQKIEIIDSKSVTFGLGLLAIKAAKMVKENCSFDEIVNEIDDSVDRLVSYFIVDTLEYLEKGGRISKSEALIGNMFKIKPILSIEDGKLISIDKVRGRKKAINWLYEKIKNEKFDNKIVGIYHANDEIFIEKLKDEVSHLFKTSNVYESEVGSVVGTHSGPGCIAISYIDYK